ncbi:MAG TPA: DUF1254 domain-containing protein [Novosphingobium sp.]|nr:DUF1254 domain-containing protein [Novosphingobium sp.]HQA18429.1 DUF1254 domain-containing protein [Novosphingobium sp.]
MTDNPRFVLPRRELLRYAVSVPLASTITAIPSFAAAARKVGAKAAPSLMQAAFDYAFPLFEYARVNQNLTKAIGNPGTLNTITPRSRLSDHTSRNVTAPNNDTIYSSAFFELSGGPIELAIPTLHDRYFSVAFMDAFTDNFAYVGTRETKGVGGRTWLVGPNWRGTVPAGVRLIRSTTNDVWMLARILVDGPADLAAAEAVQKQVTMTPIAGRPAARGFAVQAAREALDPANFLAVVNDMLARSAGGRGHLLRAARFASLGIGAKPASPAVLAAWGAFLPGALADLREGFLFRDQVVNGWSYQLPGVGNFGTNDHLRAIVALGGIAALSEKEAMYFHASFEANGQRLDGSHAYRWRLPPGGVPAEAFWSLTMYEASPDGRYYLVENPIQRYSIGDRTAGLVREADGSTVILIQRERPEGPMAANWLPSPAGPMRLALRAYMPKAALIERKWRIPAIERQ